MTRSEYERDQMEREKEALRDYKQMMIEDILEMSDKWTEAELRTKTVRTLERIYDHC